MISATTTTVFDIQFIEGGAPAPGVSPYSARGLKGTLSPIDAAKGSVKLRRTVNGTLIDVSAMQMRKYQLEVTGRDQAPPALDGVWVGMAVVVDCHLELAYLTAGGAPGRTPVTGSERIEGAYTYYRPEFSMRVVDLQTDLDEWAADVGWSLTLEEI
jgi:hypothetical protein